MSNQNDYREKNNFFQKMRTAEHKGFEISMFVISLVLALAVVVSVVWIGIYFRNSNAAKVTEAEANAGSVTESAVVADEKEPMSTPDGNAVISDTDYYDNDIDPDLKDAKAGYTTAVVNLRSSASLTASVVTKVPMGVKVKFLGLNDDGWMEVSYKGQTGFIHARYLSVTKIEPLATVKPSAEPQKTAEPTATPKVKPTKKPQKTKRPHVTEEPEVDETEEPVETLEPTSEPTAEPTAAPTERPTKEPVPTPDATKKADVVSEE